MGRLSLLIICLEVTRCSLLADIIVDEGGRPVRVQIPSSYDEERPMPLIIELHAYRAAAGSTDRSRWRLDVHSESDGFLYAGPSGLRDQSGRYYWNATDSCCANHGAGDITVDDSGYLRRVIDEIRTRLNVDRDRIYVVGFSNGGFMAHRMACDHADVLAGAVSQSGATWEDPAMCTPEDTVHVLQIHGTQDGSVFYGGGSFGTAFYPGAIETVERWAALNGCSPERRDDGVLDYTLSLPGEESIVNYYSECAAGGTSELWSAQGAGHSFGGELQAATQILGWIREHPKREPPVSSFSLESAGGLQVTFDASSSTAPTGTSIVRYLWDFGDGRRGEGMIPTHDYELAGRYLVSLAVVTDDERYGTAVYREATVSCLGGDVAPWQAVDVGEPAVPGGARTGPLVDSMTICAGGFGVNQENDEFHFAYQEIVGDFRLSAEVVSLEGGSRGAAAGVMFREGEADGLPLDPRASFAAALVDTSTARSGQAGRFELRGRISSGERSFNRAGEGVLPASGWVRLERRGTVVLAYSSLDGTSWTLFAESELPDLPRRLLAGIAVYGKDLVLSAPTSFVAVDATVSSVELIELPGFLRGDCDGDGDVSGAVNDAITLLSYNFVGGATPSCLAACDADGDGLVSGVVADAVYLLSYSFLGGPSPVAPFPECAAFPARQSDRLLGCSSTPEDCR